jgi:hypothetical protein
MSNEMIHLEFLKCDVCRKSHQFETSLLKDVNYYNDGLGNTVYRNGGKIHFRCIEHPLKFCYGLERL